MSHSVRQAHPRDVAELAEIERAAGRLFPEGRIPSYDDVTDADELLEACAAGLLLVVELDSRVVGFACCAIEAERLHLYELAVHPDAGRRGIGADLVSHVQAEAVKRNLSGVSLTTFSDLRWNGPFYRRMGFTELAHAQQNELLRGLLAAERNLGMRQRVAMLWLPAK